MTTVAPAPTLHVIAAPPERAAPRALRHRLLAPARVRELSRLAPWRAVVDTVWCWGCIVGAWAAVAARPEWWTVAIAVPLIGNRYYALFIIGHDGMHRRVMRHPRANDLFCDLLIYGPIGAITRINNRNHLLHHRHLATDRDPDRHKHACFNKADRRALIAYLVGLSSLVPSVANVFAGRRTRRARSSPYTPRDVAILLGWPAVLVTGLTWAIGWWAYPVLWLVPVYAFSFLADNLRSFAEHAHAESDEAADEHRLITYRANPIERAIFAPMNMNYHAAHHLWPSIPYYRLPQADREIRRAPAAEEIVVRRSYLAYLLRYWLALPIEACRGGSASNGPRRAA